MRRIFFRVAILFACVWIYNDSFGQPPSDQLFRKGFYYLSVDREEAIHFLSQAIDRDSSRAKYFYFRGLAKFKLGRYLESVDDFKKALSRDTTMVIGYMYQALAFRNEGEFEKATKLMDKFIETNGQDSTGYVYLVRGKTRLDAGDVDGALRDFAELTTKHPEDEQYNYYNLVAMTRKGDFAGALDEANRLISRNPDFYGYYFYRGNVHLRMGSFTRAMQDYTASITFNEMNADAFYQRGVVLDTLRKHDEAIEDYTVAISINSRDGAYYSRRGNSRFTVGNKEGACLDWTIAGNLGYYEDFEKVKKLCD